jgi:hypothetical protein
LTNHDSEFDQRLDQIREGVQDLAEIAAMQGEEVKRQYVMLDNLGKHIYKVFLFIFQLFAVGFGAVFCQAYRMYSKQMHNES